MNNAPRNLSSVAAATSASYAPRVRFLTGFLVKQPLQNETAYKPFETNYNQTIFGELVDATHGGQNLGPLATAKVASKIIMPSAQSMGTVDIIGGWHRHRFSAIMLFQIEGVTTTTTECIVAYSDRADVSHGNIIDPDTVFTIDSRMVVNETPTGFTPMAHVQNLRPITTIDVQDGTRTLRNIATRPRDTFCAMQQITAGETGEAFDDTRSLIRSQGTSSDSYNNISGQYLSKMMNAYKAAKLSNEDNDIGFGGESMLLGDAIATTSEHDNSASQLMNLLQGQTQYGSNGTFSYGELISIFPDADNKIKMIAPCDGEMENVRGNNQHWHGNIVETQVAYKIASFLPIAMIKRLLVELKIVITKNPDGTANIATFHAAALFRQVMDVPQRVEDIKAFLNMEIIPYLNQVSHDYNIVINATAFNMTDIQVALDGRSNEPYRSPSYCSSLGSSLITQNEESKNDLAWNFVNLMDDAYGDKNPSMKTNPNIIKTGVIPQNKTFNTPNQPSPIMVSSITV